METLNSETIDLILSEKFNADFWLFELGRCSSQNSGDTAESGFMYSFWEVGKSVWDLHRPTLGRLFCDMENKVPLESVKVITEGSVRDMIVNVVGILLASQLYTLAIAIPFCSLILKLGIEGFCSSF